MDNETVTNALKLWLQSEELPPPELEHQFCPGRRWRFDYAWPALKFAVECEGGAWSQGRHTRGKGYIADMEKYNEAQLLGWLVLRFTPQQLVDGWAWNYISEAIKQRRDNG